MANCNFTEKAYGLQLTTIAILSSGGTLLTIPSSKWSDNFSTITMFNDTNAPVRFSYMSVDGGSGEFIVPLNKVFTRKLFNTSFIKSSLLLNSTDDTDPATGVLTINLGV